MKNYKDDLKTIFQVLTYILIYMSFVTMDNPVLSYTFIGIFIVFIAYELYSKMQYRKGKANYVLFPTLNDLYSKMTSITIGLMAITASIIAVIWTNTFNHYCVIGLCVGLLIFLNGIFDLPNGLIKIRDNSLKITGLKTNVDQRQLKEIKIFKEKILLTNVYDELIRIDNFNINPESAKLIELYLTKNKTNDELKIINNFD